MVLSLYISYFLDVCLAALLFGVVSIARLMAEEAVMAKVYCFAVCESPLVTLAYGALLVYASLLLKQTVSGHLWPAGVNHRHRSLCIKLPTSFFEEPGSIAFVSWYSMMRRQNEFVIVL